MAPDSLVAVVLSPSADADGAELRRYAPHVTVWRDDHLPDHPDALVLVGAAGQQAPAAGPDVPVIRVDPAQGPAAWRRAAEELRRIGSPEFLIECREAVIRRLAGRDRSTSGRDAARRRLLSDHEERVRAERRRIGGTSTAVDGPDWPRFAGSETGRSAMILVNEMPIAPPVAFCDRIDKMDKLVGALGDPAAAVTVVTGEKGMGKTALLAELRLRLRRLDPRLTAAGFVYLSGRDSRRITVTTVLADLVRVVRDSEQLREARELLTAGRPWRHSLGRIIQALDGATVVLAVDDGDELIRDDGEFEDRELCDLLLDLAERPGHRVRPVFAAHDVPKVLRRRLTDRVREVPLDRGLLPEDADPLLRNLDDGDGTLGLRTAEPSEVRAACEVTGGRPRWMELFAGVLAGDDERRIGPLARDLRRTPDPGRWMFAEIAERLDRSEWRVVQALAAFGRPVEPEAINQLLHDHVPGLVSGPILSQLARRHLVRRDGRRYYLVPQPDARLVARSIPPRSGLGPDGFTMEALRLRAADYFASLDLDVREPDDLWPRFSEIELRILGGDPAAAFEVMNEIDELHLEGWGQSQALIPWRERIDGQLTDPGDAARNLWHLTKAYLQQDDPAKADGYARRALDTLRRMGDGGNALTVSIELANVWLSDGDTLRALGLYEEAAVEARRLSQRPTEAGATMNAGLCHLERGDSRTADHCFELAQALLDPYPENAQPQLRAQLLLNRGWRLALLGRDEEALELMHAALRLAERVRVERLLGTCLNGMAAVQLYGPTPEAALRTAHRAVTVGTPSGDQVLIVRSHVTLALAHHFAGRGAKAQAAISVATQRRYGQSSQLVGALAVAGLIDLAEDDVPAAHKSFVDAASMALRRIRRDDHDHQVFDARGLALTGLALSGRADRADDAVAAYDQARDITRMPGIIARNRRLLDSFGPRGDPEVRARIWRAALRTDPS